MSNPDRRCANCEAPLEGEWCHACGQRDADPRRGVFALLREGFSEVFEIDGKIPRSVGLLLARPGQLARRWLDGERARFSSPIRMYLFAVVVALLAVGFAGDRGIEQLAAEGWVQVGESPASGRQAFWIGNPETPGVYLLHFTLEESDRAIDHGFMDLVRDRPPEYATRALVRSLFDQVPAVLVVMMVLTTFLLQVAWWRRFLSEHAMFSLTLHTVGLYALVVALVVPWVGWWLAVGLVLWHLVAGLRAMYGAGWPRTVVSALVLASIWIFAFGSLWLAAWMWDAHSRGSEILETRGGSVQPLDAPSGDSPGVGDLQEAP